MPAELLDLRVERVDVEDTATTLFLWVDGSNPMRLIDGTEDEDEDGTWDLRQRMPAWTAGTYELAIGTSDEIRSNSVPVEVIVPEPQYSREEAADLVARGVGAIAGNLEMVLENPDPQWQSFMSGT